MLASVESELRGAKVRCIDPGNNSAQVVTGQFASLPPRISLTIELLQSGMSYLDFLKEMALGKFQQSYVVVHSANSK